MTAWLHDVAGIRDIVQPTQEKPQRVGGVNVPHSD